MTSIAQVLSSPAVLIAGAAIAAAGPVGLVVAVRDARRRSRLSRRRRVSLSGQR